MSKRKIFALLLILILVPLTVLLGMYMLGDRKYYFISLLIILETIISFLMMFEDKKPSAKELVLISVLCAIGVASRGVFYAIPQFKPVIALVIITAVCFDAQTGFLVGAVIGFVSNFFFGQGPWTPWQMFAFGMSGFVAGIINSIIPLKNKKALMCLVGGILTVVVFGGIVNTGSVLMYQSKINISAFITSFIMGFPFDIIHALSTVFFLWAGAVPMTKKLERIKTKYGVLR